MPNVGCFTMVYSSVCLHFVLPGISDGMWTAIEFTVYAVARTRTGRNVFRAIRANPFSDDRNALCQSGRTESSAARRRGNSDYSGTPSTPSRARQTISAPTTVISATFFIISSDNGRWQVTVETDSAVMISCTWDNSHTRAHMFCNRRLSSTERRARVCFFRPVFVFASSRDRNVWQRPRNECPWTECSRIGSNTRQVSTALRNGLLYDTRRPRVIGYYGINRVDSGADPQRRRFGFDFAGHVIIT